MVGCADGRVPTPLPARTTCATKGLDPLHATGFSGALVWVRVRVTDCRLPLLSYCVVVVTPAGSVTPITSEKLSYW